MRRRWLLLVALAGCDDKDPTQPVSTTFTIGDPPSESTAEPPDPTTSMSGLSTTSVTSGDDATSSTGPASTTAGSGYAADIAPIWAANCVAGCHTPGGVGEGLVGLLLDADAYANLVGVPAQELPTMVRVMPGDPQTSYLWHKLNGTHQEVGGAGLTMPQGGGMLPADELERIEQWISEGAAP